MLGRSVLCELLPSSLQSYARFDSSLGDGGIHSRLSSVFFVHRRRPSALKRYSVSFCEIFFRGALLLLRERAIKVARVQRFIVDGCARARGERALRHDAVSGAILHELWVSKRTGRKHNLARRFPRAPCREKNIIHARLRLPRLLRLLRLLQ